jgi:hypothetical protein
MKKILLVLLVSAAAALFALSAAATTPRLVTVAMHDPGCHWLDSHGHFSLHLATRGPVLLRNEDETIVVVRSHALEGPFGMRTIAVGRALALGRGTYRITMMGQDVEDNHLVLVVR